MQTLQNIRELTQEDLLIFFLSIGEKKFRAQQVYEWIWQKHTTSIDEMSNLALPLREKLKEHFSLPALQIDVKQLSTDGTLKTRFKTSDNHLVEGVLIPSAERKTACVSSQVGCSLSCKFCATGFMERKRNLRFDEMVDQVAYLNKQSLEIYQQKLTNIVYMGMGEPLLNYKNVLKSIEYISSPNSLAIAPRRITVSTAGVAKAIKQLGDDKVRFNLAVSLHAPTDAKRHEIMPINDTNNIRTLIDALNYFYLCTHNEITFEYILFKNFNDTQQDADDLIKIYKQVPAHLINIIEYNPISQAKYAKPEPNVTEWFMEYLYKNRINVRLRKSRGKDIDAACGQLANK